MIDQTPPAPITAGLARRLAEAADGLRDGKYYYFVSQQQYPYDLQAAGGTTDTEASYAADILRSELNSFNGKELYYKYGPYRMPEDYAQPVTYDHVEIRLLNNGAVAHCETLDGDTDAIVLNLSAFDKFLLPYYTRLYGVEVAKEMREAALTTFAGPVSQSQSQGLLSIVVTHKHRTLSTGT